MAKFLAVVLSLVVTVNAAAAESPTSDTADPTAHWYVFGVGLGLGVGGAVSWKFINTWTGEFTTIKEGYFGADTYAGGADKLGHFYTDFVLVRALNSIYEDHGYSKDDALWNGAWASFTIRTVMEVADGFTTFKFSREDLIANTAGTLVSTYLLAHPALDQIFSFSWSYMPSQEKLDGKVDWSSIDNDYNGSIYHFDVRWKGLARLVVDRPTALDFYTTSISYETRGYDKERPNKQRIVGLSFGVNLEEVIDQYAASDSWLQKAKPVVRYYKVPYTFGGPTYDLDNKKYGFRFGLNYFY